MADLGEGVVFDFVEGDDGGIFGEVRAVELVVELEFAPEDLVVADGVAIGIFGEFEHVEEYAGAFDVAEKTDAKPCALVCAFDQAGDIGHDERFSSRGLNDAKVGGEGGKGVFGDLGLGFGDVGDQRGFADVGEAEYTDICEQFEFETKGTMFARLARFGKVRSLAGGGHKGDVSAPTASTSSDTKCLVVIDEIGE